MELREYIRHSHGRWLLPLLVPLIAALVGAVVASRQPRTYTAEAVVAIPALYGEATPFQVAQGASDFLLSVHTSAVVDGVAADTGRPPAEIAAGLRATRAAAQGGESNLAAVSFSTSQPEDAEAVVAAAVRRASALLLENRVAAGEEAVVGAREALQKAQKALRRAQERAAVPEALDAQRAAVSLLERARADLAMAPEGSAEAAALEANVAVLSERVDELRPIARRLASLDRRRTRADRVLERAEKEALAARATLETAETAVAVSAPRADGRRPVLGRYTAVGGAVGLAVAFLLLLALEAVRPTRAPAGRPRQVEEAGSASGLADVGNAGTAPPPRDEAAAATGVAGPSSGVDVGRSSDGMAPLGAFRRVSRADASLRASRGDHGSSDPEEWIESWLPVEAGAARLGGGVDHEPSAAAWTPAPAGGRDAPASSAPRAGTVRDVS